MNSSWLSFQPVFAGWLLGLILLSLTAFFIWKEVARRTKLLSFRILAVGVMMTAIAGLLFQPSVQKEKKAKGFILLTKGYERNRADSLSKALPSLGVLRTKAAASFPGAIDLTDAQIKEHEPDIAFVIGDGLPYYLLSENSHFAFLESKPSQGIKKITSPASVKINQQAFVTGEITVDGETHMVLRGPGEAEDSVVVKGNGAASFSLSFYPRQAGLFLYTLTIRDKQGSYSEQVPIEVLPEEKLNILLTQKYPTAEVRSLKNFLTEKGHALALRSQVSKTDFRFEFSNREPVKIDRLGKELLSSFDLVIADNESIEGMNAAERKNLEESMNEGLGILVLVNTASLNKIPLSDLPVKKYHQDTARLQIQSTAVTLPATPLLISSNVVQPVTSASTRILSGYVQQGAGKVGFQLLNETYRLALEGKTNLYANLWSPLLEQIARLKPERFNIQLANSFPYYADEPLSVRVLAAGEEPELKNDSVFLPLQEDVLIDDYWHGITWAGKPGWHTFTTQDSTALNYYVSSNGEWQSLRQANQVKENRMQLPNREIIAASPVTQSKPISRLLFFTMFLLAGAFLWLAPKL